MNIKLENFFTSILFDVIIKSDDELKTLIKNDIIIYKETYNSRQDMLDLILYSRISYSIAKSKYLVNNKEKELTFEQKMLIAQYRYDSSNR